MKIFKVMLLDDSSRPNYSAFSIILSNLDPLIRDQFVFENTFGLLLSQIQISKVSKLLSILEICLDPL